MGVGRVRRRGTRDSRRAGAGPRVVRAAGFLLRLRCRRRGRQRSCARVETKPASRRRRGESRRWVAATPRLPRGYSAEPGRRCVRREIVRSRPGEYYNWFGESRRLLGPYRVLFAIASAICIAFAALHVTAALRALSVVGVGTIVAGEYGRGVLGGVMGDFLGATICMSGKPRRDPNRYRRGNQPRRGRGVAAIRWLNIHVVAAASPRTRSPRTRRRRGPVDVAATAGSKSEYI